MLFVLEPAWNYIVITQLNYVWPTHVLKPNIHGYHVTNMMFDLCLALQGIS